MPLITETQKSVIQEFDARLMRHGIRYAVIGGLAAMAWGSERPLDDLDVRIGRTDIQTVLDTHRHSVSRELLPYRTEHWKIHVAQIILRGVKVDLQQAEDSQVTGAGGTYAFPDEIAFVEKDIEGLLLPIMPRDQLIAYKQALSRPQDLADLAAIG
ncbi:MAG TPA: hypothetical protein VMY99_01140 [Nevskiaceae bacterium]|nr:hypothetical protein [Nevskiaceae bacterium]